MMVIPDPKIGARFQPVGRGLFVKPMRQDCWTVRSMRNHSETFMVRTATTFGIFKIVVTRRL